MFSSVSKEWKQAHSQARFAILQVLIEAGQDFVSVKASIGDDGNPDLQLTLNRTKIESSGKPAIQQFSDVADESNLNKNVEYKNEKTISNHDGKCNESANVNVSEGPSGMKNTDDQVIGGESHVKDKNFP